MIEAIDTQIEAATVKSNGEVYIRHVKRWLDNPESVERVLREVPVRFNHSFGLRTDRIGARLHFLCLIGAHGLSEQRSIVF